MAYPHVFACPRVKGFTSSVVRLVLLNPALSAVKVAVKNFVF
jgi:hypothetical protein